MTSAKKVECVLNREGNVTPQVSHPHRAHRAAEEYPMTFWSSTPLTISPRIPAPPPPLSIMFLTLRPSAPLLAQASSHIPTIKTTSLAGLQSALFYICKIINDLIDNLNGVDCASRIVSIVFWCSLKCLSRLLSLTTQKTLGKQSEKAPLRPSEGPVHAKGEQRVQNSFLPKVQSRMAGAEAKHFNVLAQSWRQYELQGVEHLSEVSEHTWRVGNFALQLNKFLYATAKLNLIWFPRQPEKLI